MEEWAFPPNHSIPSHLGPVWEEGIEWNGIKGIFLEYSSFLLFGSFNEDAPRYRGRKGYPTQNVLAACSFDLKFTYVLPG